MLKCSLPLMVVFSYVNSLSTYFSVNGKIFLTFKFRLLCCNFKSRRSSIGFSAIPRAFFISLY